MAATTVTGKGLGDSQGKYKQANNSGCCGACKETEKTEQPHIKRGCFTRHSACPGNTYKASCSTSHKTCC